MVFVMQHFFMFLTTYGFEKMNLFGELQTKPIHLLCYQFASSLYAKAYQARYLKV